MIDVSLSLKSAMLGEPGNGPAPVSPITEIGTDGWTATWPSAPANVGSGVLTVTRQGHDNAGTAGTFSETLRPTSRLRQPGTALPVADQVALADYIYAGDAIVGVTNTATRAYPYAQFAWTVPDRQVIDGDSVTLSIAVSHRHARNGRPVAGVRLIVRDHLGGEATQLVTACTTRTYSASGLTASIYEGTVDVSALSSAGARGNTFTIDAEFLPWVGAAHRISTITAAKGIETNGTLTFGNNRNNWRETIYAYVSPTGDDGTGVVNTDAALARAAPFATTGAANVALRNWHNANTGRGVLDGSIMRLEEGTHTHSVFSRRTCDDYACYMEGAEGTDPALVIYEDAGANTADGFTDITILRNLTIRRSSATSVRMLDSDDISGTKNYIGFRNVAFDDNGFGEPTSFVADWPVVYLEDCTSTVRMLGGNHIVGCAGDFLIPATTSVVASDVAGANGVQPNTEDRADGLFLGWSRFSASRNDALQLLAINFSTGLLGVGIVGNTFEAFDSSSGAPFLINGDGNERTSENIVLMCNTFMGERANISYTDAGGAVRRDHTTVMRFNVFYQRNTKSGDFFGYQGEATNPARIGNWNVRYGVGAASNTIIQGQSQDSAPNGFYPRSWIGDHQPAGTTVGSVLGSSPGPLAVSFTDDQSGATGAGGGDYTPTAPTDLAVFTAAQAPYPADQMGRALTSGGVAGALQLPA